MVGDQPWSMCDVILCATTLYNYYTCTCTLTHTGFHIGWGGGAGIFPPSKSFPLPRIAEKLFFYWVIHCISVDLKSSGQKIVYETLT